MQNIIPIRSVQAMQPRKIMLWLSGVFAALMIIISLIQFDTKLTGSAPAPVAWLAESIAPLRLVNTYGPFSVMTKNRPEIIVEGSHDGVTWQPYTFKYKAGDVMRPLGWNIPHQPRVDWQLWFAAMEPAPRNPWFTRFLQRLLENREEVTKLLEANPFAESPPRYVRATLYAYRFTTPEERKRSGAVWARKPLGLYHPAISAE